MTIIITTEQTIFSCIKKLYALTEYQAHDIETVAVLRTRAPLPFSCAANNAVLLLLVPLRRSPKKMNDDDAQHVPTTQYNDTLFFVMGVLYGVMSTVRAIIFVGTYMPAQHAHDSSTSSTPASVTHHSIYSVHTVTRTGSDGVPLYIDQLLALHALSIAYQDDLLYTLTQCVQKYWESHSIQVLLLRDAHAQTQADAQELKVSLDALQQLPSTIPLPDTVLSMLVTIKQTLSLSRTELRQLRTLVEGSYAYKQSLPASFLSFVQTMNTANDPHITPEEKKALFNRCGTMLLDSLF